MFRCFPLINKIVLCIKNVFLDLWNNKLAKLPAILLCEVYMTKNVDMLKNLIESYTYRLYYVQSSHLPITACLNYNNSKISFDYSKFCINKKKSSLFYFISSNKSFCFIAWAHRLNLVATS